MTIETKNINSENALAAEIARCSEINRRVFEKTDELTRKDERELFKFEAELKAAGVDPVEVARKVYAKAGELSRKTSREILEFEAKLKATTTTQIMATETPAENNTAEEKPATIENLITTKITANGNVNFFLNGKRVDEQTALENSNVRYEASMLSYTDKHALKYFASPITAYKWIRRMSKNNRNYADGSCRIERTSFDGKIYRWEIILEMAGSLNVVNDTQLQDYIDALDAKEHIESMYRCAQNTFKHYCNSYGLTPAQAQEIYIAAHARDVYDDRIDVRAMIENFQKINSVETDGSEDDTDDQNDVFKLLPAIETLNDVDTNQTKDEMKAAADQMGLMQLNRKIADLEEQLVDNRLAATAVLNEITDDTTLAEQKDIERRYFEHASISDKLIDEKAIYTAAKSTRLSQIAAIKNLIAKKTVEEKTPLTKAQIEKLMSAIVIEREEFYDALEEAEADEEISQSHIDYLNGEIERLGTEYYELWAQLDKLNNVEENTVAQVKIAQPQDNFTAELAKLKAERDAAQMLVKEKEAELAQAKDVHQKVNDAIDRLFRNAVEELREKLLPLPIDSIRVNTQEGFQPIIYTDTVCIWLSFSDKFTIQGDCSERDYFPLGTYDTPAQVETVIDMLKAAIQRGDKEFTFPTVDELNTPPEMPPCAPKSPDITAEGNLPFNDQNTPKTAYNAQIAQVNKNAPVNWSVSFDTDKNNFPVKFKDKTITTLDSLALTKFLTPEQFFEQFKPLVDKNYSPKQQFIDDRRKELDELLNMRKLITDDAERLKSIDDMIDDIKRELLEISLE